MNNKDYICGICGYVYNESAGDSEGNVAPDTPFDDIPDSWVCPVCSAPKSEFNEV